MTSSDQYEPSSDDYERVAQEAHEISYITALGSLSELLEKERDHSYACAIGVWYWKLEHYSLAEACYRHSIKLHPCATTYFNLAVLYDDLALLEQEEQMSQGQPSSLQISAIDAIKKCISLYHNMDLDDDCRPESLLLWADSLVAHGKDYLAKYLTESE